MLIVCYSYAVQKLVLCAGPLRHFLVSRSWSWDAFSQLRLESQNDKKCDNFEEALITNNGNIEFVEC